MLLAFIMVFSSVASAYAATGGTVFDSKIVIRTGGTQWNGGANFHKVSPTDGSASLVATCCDATNHGVVWDGDYVELTKISNSDIKARMAYVCYQNLDGASRDEAYALCRACSIANGKLTYGGWGYDNRALVEGFYDQARAMSSAPANFEAFFAHPPNGNQDLLAWRTIPTGSVIVSKSSKDSTGVVSAFPSSYSLNGAVYGVYKNSNATGEVSRLTTNSNGVTGSATLNAGTYYVKEISAPKGYNLDTKIYPVYVPSGGSKTLYVTDIPKVGFAHIIKTADNSSGIVDKFPDSYKLNGAEFSIYTSRANAEKGTGAVKTLVTDASGNTPLAALPPAKYFVKETKAPANFSLDTTIHEVNIADGKTAEIRVADKPEFGKAYLKKDIARDKSVTEICPENYTLEGAKYDVFNAATNEKVGELTTKEDGSTEEILLPEGTYYAKETVAPKGYLLNRNKTADVVVKKNETSVFKHSDTPRFDPMQIKVTKKPVPGSDKNLPIEGAEYTIKYYKELKVNGERITKESQLAGLTPFRTWVFKTDENGLCAFNSLQIDGNYKWFIPEKSDELILNDSGNLVGLHGTYTIEETLAPTGFAKTDQVWVRQADFDHHLQDVIYELEDITDNEKPQTVSITLNKVDAETGLATPQGHGSLKGAKFEVFHYDELKGKNITDGYITTDENGKGTLEGLKPGVYKVKEVKAPDGYVKNKEIKSIEAGIREPNTANFDYVYKCEEKVTLTEIVKYANGLLNQKVKGAKLQVLDNLGHVLDEFTTTDSNFTIKGLKVGNYTLHEVSAPKGYVKSADVPFEIKEDTEKTEVKMLDLRVSAEKVEGVFNKPLEGAELVVTDKDGNIVDAWTTTKDKHYISGLEYGKSYVLKEVSAPEGYVKAKDIPFTVKGTDDIKLKMNDTRVSALKTDIETGKPLAGAELVVKDAEGNVVDSWTSTTEKHFVNNLEYGKTYTLEETKAPAGYVKAAKISFTADGNSEVKLEMKDDFTKLQLNKVDENGNAVKGASLQLLNKENTVVKEWTTSDKAVQFDRLPQGEYTLREVKAPEGYVKAADVKFTLKDTADIQKVTMKDIRVSALKADTENAPLKGAELTVKDASGKVVDKWETTRDKHYISGLEYGKTYTLEETKTPRGYVTAAPIEFTADGEKNISITMTDLQVIVEKTDIETGKPIRNAELEVRDSDGNVVDHWTSNGTKRYVQNLVYGKTYTLVETKAPDGYVKISPITFTVDATKNISINAKDDFIKVDFSKKMITGEDELPGATLQIIDENGNIIDQWVSTDKPHRIDRMTAGEYILKEIIPADGFVTAENVKFTVTETGEIQKVEMRDDYTKTESLKLDTEGNPVEGATLSIVPMDENGEPMYGEVFKTWLTVADDPETEVNEAAERTDYLTIGKYFLVENSAPAGYVKAAPVPFEVKDTGEIQTFTMTDKQVSVEKLEKTTGNMLIGAELVVTDSEGEVVDKWITDEHIHNISGLEEGKTYTLKEAKAPAGYATADMVEFTVNGTEDISITMEDDIIRVEILKVDEETGKVLPGAVFTLTDEEGKLIRKWTSGEQAELFEKLPAGKYTLKEVSAPKGYEKMKDQTIEVKDTAEIQKFTASNRLIPVVPEAPQTGDKADLIIWTALVTGAGILLLRVIKKKTDNLKE